MLSTHFRTVSRAVVSLAILESLVAPCPPAAAATTFELVRSFAEPENPSAPLVNGGDGFVYGVTAEGGAYGRGGVFRVDGAGTYVSLHAFSGPDGEHPRAALVLGPDGALYGTTRAGGTAVGTVPSFALTA